MPEPVFFTDTLLTKQANEAFDNYVSYRKLPLWPHDAYDKICASEGIEIENAKGKIKVLIPDRARAKELYNAAKKEFTEDLDKKNKRSGGVIAHKIAQITEDLNGNRTFEFLLKKYYLVEYFEMKIKNEK